MKTLFAFGTFFLLYLTTVNAQIKINLPHYTLGKYACDTIFKTSGFFEDNSMGFGLMDLQPELMTGVKFYIQADTISTGVAYIDSLGTKVKMKVGVKYPLPTTCESYGKISIIITLEGTPLMNGELYYCELNLLITTHIAIPQSIYIGHGLAKCKVDVGQGINNLKNTTPYFVYPNPATDHLVIDGISQASGSIYIIFDKLGRKVQTGLLSSLSPVINIQQLLPGDYLIQIDSQQQTLKFVKK